MSCSRTFMSPYFLTALAIPSLTIFHQTSSSRTCPFFFNQFSRQRQKSSKDAAAITTALSKLLRWQRQRVATLLQKKLAWERKLFLNCWKLSNKYVSFVYLKLLVWCNMFKHDRGAEGKKFKSTSKTFHPPPSSFCWLPLISHSQWK